MERDGIKMENASQALIMAGGILIGIIIISMGVYLFSQAAALPQDYNARLEQEKLAGFNSQFEAYNHENVSAQDIVTVINLAIENNRNYQASETGYYINVYLDGEVANAYTEEQKVTLMQESLPEDFFAYHCTGIEYSEVTGRVIAIRFAKK